MEAEGKAITSVSSGEENDLHGIEKVFGKAIPHVTLPDFDYRGPPTPKVCGRGGLTRSGGWRPARGRSPTR